MNLSQTLAGGCAALLLSASLGCQPYGRATMFPGVDCIQCHSAAASSIPGACSPNVTATGPFCNGSALQWTAAGTIFPDINANPDAGGVPDVHIFLQDALGKQVNLTSNSAGNFFTDEPMEFDPIFYPDGGVGVFTVQIQYQGQCLQMLTHPAPDTEYPSTNNIGGVGCNRCHNPTLPSSTPGRIPAPGLLSIPQGQQLGSVLPGFSCPYLDGGACSNPDPCTLCGNGVFCGKNNDLP